MAPRHDLIANLERLTQQDQNTGEHVLQDILEREPYRNRADAEPGNQIPRSDRWRDDGDGQHKADNCHRPPHQRATNVPKIITPAPTCRLADQRTDAHSQEPKDDRHHQCDTDIWEQSKEAVQPPIKFIKNQAGVCIDFFHRGRSFIVRDLA